MVKIGHCPFFNWELRVQRLSPDVLDEGPTNRIAVMSALYLHVVDLLTRLFFNNVSLYEALPFVGDQIQLDISCDLDNKPETQVKQGLIQDDVTLYECVSVITNSFDSIVPIRSSINFCSEDRTPINHFHLQLVVSNVIYCSVFIKVQELNCLCVSVKASETFTKRFIHVPLTQLTNFFRFAIRDRLQ